MAVTGLHLVFLVLLVVRGNVRHALIQIIVVVEIVVVEVIRLFAEEFFVIPLSQELEEVVGGLRYVCG